LNRNIFMIVGLTLLLVACGSNAAPTLDLVQIDATAAVMASTMSAQTQAAVPTLTSTPLPTPTSIPTSTETPIPTVVELSPTSIADPCDGPLFAGDTAGKTNNATAVLIRNSTKAPITVSLYLSKNEFGQCGSVSYSLAPSQSVSISGELPYGCYYASAYVNDPKKPTRPNGDSACITGPDKTTITVIADRIKITGP
jgi:hypothetical protein